MGTSTGSADLGRHVLDDLAALTPADLRRTVTIRGEPHTVLEALHRQYAHYAYHVGQMVLLTRHHAGGRAAHARRGLAVIAPRTGVATARAPWAALLPAALPAVLLVALLGAGCAPSRHDDLAFHRSAETAALGLPFSDVVRAGELVFVSGQVGNRPGTLELVPGGVGPESRQALENLRAALRAAGSDLDRVVKVTVFLADIAEWPAFNAVYVEVFGDHLPARSAVAGSGLALGARVEVECIALAGD